MRPPEVIERGDYAFVTVRSIQALDHEEATAVMEQMAMLDNLATSERSGGNVTTAAAVYQQDGDRRNWPIQAELARLQQEAATNQDLGVIFAINGLGIAVGMLKLVGSEGSTLTLADAMVLPGDRGNDVYTTMVRHSLAVARQEHYKQVTASNVPAGPAQHVLEKLQFETAAETMGRDVQPFAGFRRLFRHLVSLTEVEAKPEYDVI